jgi:hypothetical protein
MYRDSLLPEPTLLSYICHNERQIGAETIRNRTRKSAKKNSSSDKAKTTFRSISSFSASRLLALLIWCNRACGVRAYCRLHRSSSLQVSYTKCSSLDLRQFSSSFYIYHRFVYSIRERDWSSILNVLERNVF